MVNGLIGVAEFLIGVVFGLYAFILLLRFFLQWVKADFYNPICQLVMKATNIFVMPVRKIVPGFFHLDWSCIVVVYIVFAVQNLLLGFLKGYGFNEFFVFVKPFVDMTFAIIQMYIFLIIIRALSSWFNQGGYNPALAAIFQVTEPLLFRARRIIKPTATGLDFSPMIVLLSLFCIQIFLGGVFASLLG